MFESGMKFLAYGLLVAGFVLVMNPNLISSTPLPSDVYEAVEVRALWGMIVGFGAMLLVHNSLLPWLPTVVALLASVPFGVTLARLMAIVVEGATAKNWLWVVVDGGLFLALAWWYRYLGRDKTT